DQRGLLEFIERRGAKVTVRDVITCYWRLKNQREKAEFELNMLAKAAFGKWEETHQDGRGRPTRVFQLLHTSASAKIPEIRAKTANCADAEAPNRQKITPFIEPDKEAVSGELEVMPTGILEL